MNLEDILHKNSWLKNIHAGKRCFIVGNGPSLQSQDISPLEDEITIVVSWFHRHPLAKQIRPGYWVLADPAGWQRSDEPFLPAIQQVHNNAMSTRLFVPSGGFPYYANMHTGPFVDLHFFHFDGQKTIESPIDLTTGIPPFGQNVIIVCLMLAFHLGCNPIYLTGCDHDFLNVTRQEYEQKEERHFYQEKEAAKYALEFGWEEFRRCMDRVVYEYDQLSQYAQQRGIEIYNATRGGCLEHFPRVEFEALFAPSSARQSGATPLVDADLIRLTDAAIRLYEAGEHLPALTIVEEALRNNYNRRESLPGLNYLKAACLARLGRHAEALLAARLDYAGNAANRGNAGPLISQMESIIKGNLP